MDDFAIKVDHVNKVFKLPHEKQGSIKNALIGLAKGSNRSYEKQQVLKDVSFEIKKGEFFGIVGRNGSGKSTLLKMLAGIYAPTKGGIQVNGKLTPFIELGVGFNPELTGRENVFLNGALLGFNRREMTAMYDDIVAFAELSKFMDQKLKNYSSGMQVRLAFSIAIRAKSDILLIDEVLAVGDAAFQAKCFDYFYKLKATDTTVIFVSHDQGSLERFCDRGILINDGEMVVQGPIGKVLAGYSKIVLEELENGEDSAPQKKNEKKTSTVTISEAKTLNDKGRAQTKFTYGEEVTISFKATFRKTIDNPIFGFTLWVKNVDSAVFAANTITQGIEQTGAIKAGQSVTISMRLPQGLNNGTYFIEPAVANDSANFFYAQEPKAATFYISGSSNPHAILASEEKMEVKTELSR